MDEWFRRGIETMMVSIVIMTVAVVGGWEYEIVLMLLILGFVMILAVEWLFTDMSEEEINRDLERISKDVK